MDIKFGIVEDRDDPLKLGRVRVRVFGTHTHDKSLLPTKDLPWAVQIINNSPSMNGIGSSPTNLVEGTTVAIVFMDTDQQLPLIFGSVGGIPHAVSKLIESNDESFEIDLDEDETDDESVAPVSEAPTKVDTKVVVTPSTPGFAPLNKAMDDAGITSNYARASILGICQVESNFSTKAENLNYSAEGLLATFPSIIKGDIKLAKSIEKNPEKIGEFIYGPGGKGKELGNMAKSDGYRYRGRGYVQLTGKANYKKYSSVAGIDLVSNPDAMLDPNISSVVTVAYFIDRVKLAQDNPNYYNQAIKAVGNNRADIKERKYNAYLYFLGDTNGLDQTDKSTDSGKSQEQHSTIQNGLPKDRIEGTNYGFSDPNLKYPLKNYLNEPDTNRLARGRYTGTVVSKKDKSLKVNIPVSDGSIWSQPDVPFNAEYPYNHVYESESGHIQEFDDTPGNERIHTFHRKGTFEEIDANGSKVTRIVGDNYELLDRNGYIYISGDYNLTATGNINILSQSGTNIKVQGDANINVHGDINTNVAGNYNLSVNGTYNVKANSIINETNSWHVDTSNLNETISGESHYRYDGDKYTHIGADTYNRHSSGTDYGCPSDPARSSGQNCSNVDGANSTGLTTVISKIKSASPKYSKYKTPVRRADKVFIFESPDELIGTTVPVIENAMPENDLIKPESVVKNKIDDIPASCEIYKNMENFDKSLILHVDSTGYKWTLGKLLRQYQLKEITVKGKSYSKSDIVCNLKQLAENVLGKLNEKIGQVDRAWSISSCYRNSIPSGGSATSQHLTGQAVDIKIGNDFNYNGTYDWAKDLSSNLPYDQFILEYLDSPRGRLNWIHMSYKSGGRRQLLTFLNHKTASSNSLKKLA